MARLRFYTCTHSSASVHGHRHAHTDIRIKQDSRLPRVSFIEVYRYISQICVYVTGTGSGALSCLSCYGVSCQSAQSVCCFDSSAKACIRLSTCVSLANEQNVWKLIRTLEATLVKIFNCDIESLTVKFLVHWLASRRETARPEGIFWMKFRSFVFLPRFTIRYFSLIIIHESIRHGIPFVFSMHMCAERTIEFTITPKAMCLVQLMARSRRGTRGRVAIG